MTSKIVVNNIEADAGISSVTLNSNIAGEDSTQNISGINSVTATTFYGNVAGNLTGTIQTAAQTNITSVGTLTGLTLNGVLDVNVPGTQFNGGTGNASGTDAVVYIDKENNNDWCLKLKPNQGSSTNYGLVIEAENATSQAFVIKNSDDSNNSQFYINGEGDYFTGNSYPRSDGNKDLGYHSGYKWRDVVLSGGVRFGNANAANYLDDYEEGNYDVSVTGSGGGSIGAQGSINNLRYTKIGRLIHVMGRIYLNSSNSPSGSARMSLPFTSSANTNDQNGQGYSYVTRYNVYNPNSDWNMIFEIEPNQSYGVFLWDKPGAAWDAVNAGNQLNQNACYLGFDFTYTSAT